MNRDERLLKRLFIGAGLFFLFMGGSSFVDIFHDRADDLSQQHLLMEVVTLFISLAGAAFFINSTMKLIQKNAELHAEVKKGRVENEAYRKKMQQFSEGLSQAIDEEFNQWLLTETEKQVGLLILKGLSIKSIAEILGTSEKTTRHHCSSIYKKSGLGGRSELSAYFLEDLLVTPRPSI